MLLVCLARPVTRCSHLTSVSSSRELFVPSKRELNKCNNRENSKIIHKYLFLIMFSDTDRATTRVAVATRDLAVPELYLGDELGGLKLQEHLQLPPVHSVRSHQEGKVVCTHTVREGSIQFLSVYCWSINLEPTHPHSL